MAARVPTPSPFLFAEPMGEQQFVPWSLWGIGVLVSSFSFPPLMYHYCSEKKEGRLEGFWKKMGDYSRHFVKGGKLRGKGASVGGGGAVNGALSGSSSSWNLVLAFVVQFKLSPLVLSGFSALGPEPQQIGAYLPIHTRLWKLINRLISYTIHGRPLTKGVPATWRGKRKKLQRDYFLIQKPRWCESFPRPSEVTRSLNMMTGLVFFVFCFCFF